MDVSVDLGLCIRCLVQILTALTLTMSGPPQLSIKVNSVEVPCILSVLFRINFHPCCILCFGGQIDPPTEIHGRYVCSTNREAICPLNLANGTRTLRHDFRQLPPVEAGFVYV